MSRPLLRKQLQTDSVQSLQPPTCCLLLDRRVYTSLIDVCRHTQPSSYLESRGEAGLHSSELTRGDRLL